MVGLVLPRVISLVFVALEAMTVAWFEANGKQMFQDLNEEENNTKEEGNNE